MKQEVTLKPFQQEDGIKYKIIHLTDFKLHSTHKNPTPSTGKKISKSFQNKMPGRIYTSLPKSLAVKNDNSFILEALKLDSDFVKMVQEEEAKGYKVLISIPKEGVPVYLGEDTIEFIKSKNGQRLIRKLAIIRDGV